MTSKEKVYDIIVVGNGLPAKLILQRIFEVRSDLNILQLAHEGFAPSCSERTTAVITSNGIRKGISELGDLLVDSFEFTQDYLEQRRPAGVESVEQTYMALGKEEIEQLKRRFGTERVEGDSERALLRHKAFLFVPQVFYNWLENHYCNKEGYRQGQELVTGIEKKQGHYLVSCHSSNHFVAKKVIVCTGAYGQFIQLNSQLNNSLVASAPVSGSYLSASWAGGDKGFVFSFKGFNLIYRSLDQTLMIGGDTDKKYIISHHYARLREYYQLIIETLADQYTLPSFEDFEIKTGLRHKGKKRKPFWGEIDQDLFCVHSLYKNGFTFSFLAAEDVLTATGILNP